MQSGRPPYRDRGPAPLNRVELGGRIHTEIDFRHDKRGSAIAAFTLTVPSGSGEDLYYFRVVAFGELAVGLQMATRGEEVRVLGKLSSRLYQGPEGKKLTAIEVIADEVFPQT